MSGRNLAGLALMAVGALLLIASMAAGCLTAFFWNNTEMPIENPTVAVIFDVGLAASGVAAFAIGQRLAKD